ncbi:MAG: hypothetical protein HFF17_02860, partial [Oscillospiraceae bacterium]|nr:hypothetical protein [Oscillospiraceae bacterium]
MADAAKSWYHWVFGFSTFFNGFFSTDFLHFFYGFSALPFGGALEIQNMERYRSGHNGADSKSSRLGVRLTPQSLGITGFSVFSTFFNGFFSTDFLHFFYGFSALLFGGALEIQNMERYRSGHNGADSKSVCRKLH